MRPVSRFVAALQPLGLKLANAFGVTFKLNQYLWVTRISEWLRAISTNAVLCISFSLSFLCEIPAPGAPDGMRVKMATVYHRPEN